MKPRFVFRTLSLWLTTFGAILSGGSAMSQDKVEAPRLFVGLAFKSEAAPPKGTANVKVLALEIGARGDVSIPESTKRLSPGRELQKFLKKEYALAEGNNPKGPPTRIVVQVRPQGDAQCGAVAEVIVDCQAVGFIAARVPFGDKPKELLLRLEPSATQAELNSVKEPTSDLDPEFRPKLAVSVDAVTKGDAKGSIARVAVRTDIDVRDFVLTKDDWADQLAKRFKEETELLKRPDAKDKKTPRLLVTVRASADLTWSALCEVVAVCAKAGAVPDSLERERRAEPQ